MIRPVLAFRQLFSHLREGFSTAWAFYAACVLLTALDAGALFSLVWFFLFRSILPVRPETIMWLGAAYVLLAALSGCLAVIFSRLRSVQTATLFYLTVGVFFALHGLLSSADREFALWPWVLLWAVTLTVVLVQFGREFASQENETPHE